MTQADRVLSTPPTNTPIDKTRRFETLKDAEDALMEQGFKLVPDTCNWIDDAAQIDAGVYPVEESNGVSKYRIEYRSRHHRAPVDTTRRHFLLAVGGGSAAMLATTIIPEPAATALDPVVGLIEAHRTASAAHSLALKEQARLESIDDPLADSVGAGACHADVSAFHDLIQTAPTTLAGLVAWASYLDEIRKVEAWMLEGKAPTLVVALVEALGNLEVTS